MFEQNIENYCVYSCNIIEIIEKNKIKVNKSLYINDKKKDEK